MLNTLEDRRLNLERSLGALLSKPETWGDTLRPYYYQNDAVRGVQDITRRNRTASYVHMPTSSGKSEVMAGVVFSLIQNALSEDLPRIWIVEPTQKLVRDTRDRILRHFPKVPVGVYYSDEQDLGKAVTVTTGDGFLDLLQLGVLKPSQVDYLQLDEAHRWLTGLRRNTLKPFYDTTVITGYTATIQFNKLKALYRTLGEEAYSIGYPELIAKGHIGERANVIVGMKLPKGAGSQEERKAYSQAVVDILLHYQDSLEGNEDITGDKTIITHWKISEANYTASLLNSNPEIRRKLITATGNPDIIPAAIIHGGQKELDKIVEDFDDGKIGYLLGVKIPGEGLNTKARHVITPERWSELDVEQVGGRVRDRSGMCRVFTILREDSGKRKSAFYAEAIGAARITRDGVQYGLAQPLEQLALTHPPVGNLNIYNTPNEVASYIKSRESKLRTGVANYLGASRMAETLGVWPAEVQYIYSLLEAQHKALPDREQFCNVGGVHIPREFLTRRSDKHFAVRDHAAEIIQDIIGEYPERSDNVIVYADIESDLATPQKGVKFESFISGTRQIYRDAERAYAKFILPWKHGTATDRPETTKLPAVISAGSIRIPFHHIGMYLDEDGFSLGIRDSSLGRFWAQQVPTPTDFIAAFGKGHYISELVETSCRRRDERLKNGYVEVSADVYDSIVRHTERTGKKAVALYASATDLPEGLTFGKLVYFLVGNAQGVKKEHQDWILAKYESLPDKEPVVDFRPGSRHRAFLDKLMAQKGNPTATRILQAMPVEARETDANGAVVFDGRYAINNIFEHRQHTLRRSQAAMLFAALRKIEPMFFLDEQPRHREFLDRALARNGNPGAQVVKKAMPAGAMKLHVNGDEALWTINFLHRVLTGDKVLLRRSELATIIRAVRSHGPREETVDLCSGSRHRKFLDKLLIEAGDPKAARIFRALPDESKEAGAKGRGGFGTFHKIHDVLTGVTDHLRRSQLAVLFRTLRAIKREGLPEELVDIRAGSPHRKYLDSLLDKRGNARAIRIFNALPAASREAGANGVGGFGTFSTIHNVIIGHQETLRRSQLAVLLRTLRGMSDVGPREQRVDMHIGSRHRNFLDKLLARKGNPGSVRIFKALPEETRKKGLNGGTIGNSSVIEATLAKEYSLRRSQLAVILRTLRAMKDAGPREKTVDVRPGSRHLGFLQRLVAEKGNPRVTHIFRALPARSREIGANGPGGFGNSTTIYNVLAGQQDTLRRSQLAVLLKTIRGMPVCHTAIDAKKCSGEILAPDGEHIAGRPGRPNASRSPRKRRGAQPSQ